MLLTNEDKRFIIKYYPGLIIESNKKVEGFINFKGFFSKKTKTLISNEKGENYLEFLFKIRIIFNENNFPYVYEVNGDLERGLDFHIYNDGKFCLTHTLFEEKYKNKDFQFILEELIIPFLYNQAYNIKYGNFLWEYGHNFEGTFEFIYDNNIGKKDYMIILKNIKNYIKNNLKLFLYSKQERKRLIELLKLKSKKSKSGFEKFIKYLKQHTNLFTKI